MTTITAQTVKERLDAGEQLNLLDVREDFERQEFNIGGIHLKLGLIQTMQVEEIESLKDAELVIYCRSGQRSAMACQILQHIGFTNVANLEGGMMNWRASFNV
jgi:rhodanese-related sulfurtransferase